MRALIAFILLASSVFAQYKPSESSLKSREWFQDARFGMFIHWGVYAVPGRGEWVMNQEKIPIAEYEKLAPQFNPTEFNAAEWVTLAKRAGMKYIVITSKHHDGFAMFATRQNKWNIVDATPYGKDPLAALAEECRKQGIKLFFYYSQLDWHHPDYYPLGDTGHTARRPSGGDWERYLQFMDAQLTELLTNYGPIGGIWFDGWWDKPNADWKLQSTYSLIHSLQPAALVGSNHHRKPNEGEDFQMFERDLPGENTAGYSGTSEVGTLPLETCDTINGSWGYNANDKSLKTTRQLIHYLVRAAGHNANFLLNVGPMPNGKIQSDFVSRLNEIGSWLDKNGETIFGTRGTGVKPRPWGAITRTGSRTYVHVLDWNDELLALPDVGAFRKATLFSTGAKIETTQMKGGVILRIPHEMRDPVDTIIVLEK